MFHLSIADGQSEVDNTFGLSTLFFIACCEVAGSTWFLSVLCRWASWFLQRRLSPSIAEV